MIHLVINYNDLPFDTATEFEEYPYIRFTQFSNKKNIFIHIMELLDIIQRDVLKEMM